MSRVLLIAAAFSLGAPHIVNGADWTRPLTFHPSNTGSILELDSDETAWAQPLDGGPIRAVVVVPRHGLGDVLAVAKRLEMDVELVEYPVSLDPNGEEFADWLGSLDSTLGKRFDVILMGGFPAATLPHAIWTRISERVRDGAGLVVANTGLGATAPVPEALRDMAAVDGRDVVRGLGHELLPEWDGQWEFLRLGSYGDGRVCLVDYGVRSSPLHLFLPRVQDGLRAAPGFFDNYVGLGVRALTWAAQRDHSIRIESVEIPPQQQLSEPDVPPHTMQEHLDFMADLAGRAPSRRYIVTLSAPADRRYDLEYDLRDPLRGTRFTPKAPVRVERGASAVTIEAPSGAGPYFVDAWLKERGNVVDWFSRASIHRTWPEIESFRVSKAVIAPNDTVSLSFDTRQNHFRPRPFTVYARGVDSLGRHVAERRYVVNEGGRTVQMPLDFVDLVDREVRIEVFAVDAVSPPGASLVLTDAAYDYARLSVTQPFPTLGVAFLTDGEAVYDYGAAPYIEQFARLGVDGVVADNGIATRPPSGFGFHLVVPEADWDILPTTGPAPTASLRPARVLPGSVAAERLRSYASNSTFVTVGVPDVEGVGADSWARWIPWYGLTRGFDGVWLTTPLQRVYEPAFAPDATPAPWIEVLASAVQTARDGYARLLAPSRRVSSPVAVFDAVQSAGHASDRSEACIAGTTSIVSALGYSYDLVTAEGIRDGVLSNYALLALPDDAAMDDETTRRVQQFVDNGGNLLASLLPVGSAAWSGMFGVRRVDEPSTTKPLRFSVDSEIGGNRSRFRLSGLRYDASIRSSGAPPLGARDDGGIFFYRQQTGAKSLLLNFPIANLEMENETTRRVLDLAGDILAEMGIHDSVSYEMDDSARTEVEVHEYRYGANRLTVFLRHPTGRADTATVRVAIPEEHIGYDAASGQFDENTLRLKLDRGGMAVVSTLPYEVDSIAITAPPRVNPGGLLQFDASLSLSGDAFLPRDHVFTVTIRGPEDGALRHYTRILDAPVGSARSSVRLALDERPGAYTLTVRDVLTGFSSSHEFTVIGRTR